MRLTQRTLCTALASVAFLGVTTTTVFSQEFTFTIHHFLSPKAPAQTVLIEPWAKKIEAESGGRIKFEIFPSMSMGGKPRDLYKQVRDGVADIVWTSPGYTPGVFPRVEVFELPGVHNGDAKATNLAIQDMMGEIGEDLKKIKPLLIHVHAGNALHTVSKDIKYFEDLKGLKLRSPSRTGAWMVESWGAEPVGMPVPALPQALAKNAIDGALIPFEVAIPLKIAELTDFSVEMYGGERFGTATFMFAMNQNSFNSLPDDLKKIIDDNSGAAIAPAVGEAWNNIEPIGKKVATDKGKSVSQLSAAESAKFSAASATVIDRWIGEVKGNSIDGRGLVTRAQEAIAKHSK